MNSRNHSARPDAIAALDEAVVRLARTFELPAVRAFVESHMPTWVDLRHHRILRAIEHLGEPSVGELANRLDLEVSTVSRHVDRAIDAGLVARVRSSEDGRRRTLSLTEKGERALQAGNDVRHQLWDVLSTDIDPADLAAVTEVLVRLREAAEQLDQPDAG